MAAFATLDRRALRLLAASLLLTASCRIGPTVDRTSLSPQAAAVAAAATAFRAAPLDSLCAEMGCRVIVVDSVIGRAPVVAPFQANKMSAIATIGSRFRLASRSPAKLFVSSGFRVRGETSDTLSVALALVGDSSMTSAAVLEAIVYFDAPRTMGGFFVVDLSRTRHSSWVVRRIRNFEG